MRAKTGRWSWITAVVAAVIACEGTVAEDGVALDRDTLGGDWNTDPSVSPTGTTLLPKAPQVSERGGISAGAGGYAIVDEVCGAVWTRDDRTGRADVFKSPMFRAFLVRSSRAYAVDGTNLWTFSVDDPKAPSLLDVRPVSGTPVALAVSGSSLLLAGVDGLRALTLDATGAATGEEALLVDDALGPVLDVTVDGDLLFVALGEGGLLTGRLVDGALEDDVVHKAFGLANAVAVTPTRVAVAACLAVRVYDRTETGLALAATLPMPYGQAKSVALDGDRVWVSAGIALLGFELGDPPMFLGHYTSEQPGFYVNDVIAANGTLYLAAGDQSVRALRANQVTKTPITWDAADPTILSPLALPTPSAKVSDFQVAKDPVALTLEGEKLYALGNFRYRGRRSIDVFDARFPGLVTPIGRWEEPDSVVGATRLSQAVVIGGRQGASIVADAEQALLSAAVGEVACLAPGGSQAVVGLRAGGLRLVGSDGAVDVLGDSGTHPQAVAADATRLYVASEGEGAVLVATRDPVRLVGALVDDAVFLGDAALWATAERLLAYDRVTGLLTAYDTTAGALPVWAGAAWIGACEAYDFASTYDGSRVASARFAGDAEQVVLLCPRPTEGPPSYKVIDAAGPAVVSTVALEAGVFVDVAVAGGAVATLAYDAARLSTTLMVDTGGEREQTSFFGHGAAVAARPGGGWLVGDGFGRVARAFDASLLQTGSWGLP